MQKNVWRMSKAAKIKKRNLLHSHLSRHVFHALHTNSSCKYIQVYYLYELRFHVTEEKGSQGFVFLFFPGECWGIMLKNVKLCTTFLHSSVSGIIMLHTHTHHICDKNIFWQCISVWRKECFTKWKVAVVLLKLKYFFLSVSLSLFSNGLKSTPKTRAPFHIVSHHMQIWVWLFLFSSYFYCIRVWKIAT